MINPPMHPYMTKIETLKTSAQVSFGSDTPTINVEEYLTLLDGAKSQEEKEFYAQIYNCLLAKSQKEVIANAHYYFNKRIKLRGINYMEKNPLEKLSCDGGMTAVLRKVGCIGDSLSSGEHEHFDENGTVHYDDIYDLSWGQFLARKCGIQVYNFSVGGMTAIRFRVFAAYTKVFKPEKACKAYIIALGVTIWEE